MIVALATTMVKPRRCARPVSGSLPRRASLGGWRARCLIDCLIPALRAAD